MQISSNLNRKLYFKRRLLAVTKDWRHPLTKPWHHVIGRLIPTGLEHHAIRYNFKFYSPRSRIPDAQSRKIVGGPFFAWQKSIKSRKPRTRII